MKTLDSGTILAQQTRLLSSQRSFEHFLILRTVRLTALRRACPKTIGRGTHTVNDQCILRGTCTGIIGKFGGEEAVVRDAAPVEPSKQWLEPLGMLEQVAIPGEKRDISMPLRLQFQLNVRTIHPDFVGAHPLRRRRAEHLAGADLELGAMPGASDLVALELPF